MSCLEWRHSTSRTYSDTNREMGKLRCLPESPEGYHSSAVFCGVVTTTRRLENAGRSFFETFESLKGKHGTHQDSPLSGEKCSERGSADHVESSSKGYYEDDAKWGAKHKNDRKSKGRGAPSKLKKVLEGPNLYTVLEVESSCDTDAIRKAYHRLALEYHPDKKRRKRDSATGESPSSEPSVRSIPLSNTKGAGSLTSSTRSRVSKCQRPEGLEEYTNDEMFLLIQDAYETLSGETYI